MGESDTPEARKDALSQNHWVFAIIPVYNRLSHTLACVEGLRRQSYPFLRTIVVDGGSTDGTVETLRRDHSDVTVLKGVQDLWWAGAMELGIRYVLSKSQNDLDMVLMMNDDTIIPADYVGMLVRECIERKAAVGAVIVDSRDPSRILDAGEMVDWRSYSFPVKTQIGEFETFFDGVDFLPGRGSLVPVYMIKSAGNVDARRFPHYVADYEFFQRIRRHGFRMGVTYKTRILAHIDETGIRPGTGALSFSGAFQENFSRKSMRNILDHWKFIGTCAPEKYRFLLKRMLAKWMLYDFFFRTRLGSLSRPVYERTVHSRQSLRGLWRLFEGYVIDVHSLPHPIRWPIFFLFSPSPLTAEDCERSGVDIDRMIAEGVIRSTRAPGWYAFATLSWDGAGNRSALRGLFLRTWNPFSKALRSLKFRRAIHFGGALGEGG